MHRASDVENTEYRRAGKARRELLKRLCAIADLRPLADVLLYRPLHALARLALERLAAARGRAYARRSLEENRRAQCAGRQDAYGAGPRRPEDAQDRARLDSPRPVAAMRVGSAR